MSDKPCAAKIPYTDGCKKPRAKGSLFCERHRWASNRIPLFSFELSEDARYQVEQNDR